MNSLKTALLIVDVQYGLFIHKTPIHNEKQLLEHITSLIKYARLEEIPVIYIQHENKGILKKGSDGWGLHPSLNPLKDETIFHKKYGSAFRDTALKEYLEKKQIENLIIVGLTTHGCIKATTYDALQHGFNVTIVTDAHSSYSINAQELIDKWNLIFKNIGCKTINTTELKLS